MARGITVHVPLLIALCGAGASPLYDNCTSGYIAGIRDGECDDENNNEECGYDGGDCCGCTTVETWSNIYIYEHYHDFCLDPNSGCVNTRVNDYPNCTGGYIPYIGDDSCDWENNNEECDYDGGDCCDCSSGGDESSSLLCVNPNDICYSLVAVTLHSNCTSGNIEGIGNSECDMENNSEGCLYDGGDCCNCTSVNDDSSSFSSWSLYCVDPNATCYDLAAVALQSNCSKGTINNIGDGWCDQENNNEGCHYDGGDCCPCTNTQSYSDDYSFSNDLCRDPNSGCANQRAGMYPNCNDGDIPSIGDGFCNIDNNNEECNYDGEDCCDCTHIADGYSSFNSSFSLCVDTSHECYDPTSIDLQSRCTNGTIGDIGDGRCDMENNNEECLFDGGDCCLCTCTHGPNHYCGENGFTCLDYYIDHLEPYVCAELLPTPTSCRPGARQEWVVENSAQARALATAVRCPGDSFDVTWKGNVIVDETISISDGTVVHVTSSDNADAAIVGDGKTRLFSVVNASLHLRGIAVHNGKALYGGGIVALRSNLSFDRVAFIGNVASIDGGAMYVSNNTVATFSQESDLFNNSAYEGGGLYVTDGSYVSWTGSTVFSENVARSGHGGALYMSGNSRAIWGGNTTFSENAASYGYGGALCVTDGSHVSWRGNITKLFNNTADSGGALYVKGGRARWTATSHFISNSAGNKGGALYILDSDVAWTAASMFYANGAGSDGGAVYANNEGLLSFSNTAQFVNNFAQNGGALFLRYYAGIELGKGGSFISNHARSDGGALAVEGYNSYFSSNSEWVIAIKGATSFVNNTCGANGGAMSLIQSSSVFFDSDHITFSGNSAGTSGGAVFLEDSEIGTIFRNVLFLGNSALSGGGVYAMASGEVDNPTTFDNCNFTRNAASTTGGAVDSSYGYDIFFRTLFKGNRARTGGALRLAGTASIDNCSFDENISESGGGPALYNIGSSLNMTNTYFHHNAISCESQMILEFTNAGDVFAEICVNCPAICVDCEYEKAQGNPTCKSLSDKGVKHATSEGGTTAIEDILIDKGFWRATSKSTKVLECYNMKACKGGVTCPPDNCYPGYEGPYCSVCRKNYGASLSFTCRKCSNHVVGIATTAVLTVLTLAVGLAIVKYLMAAEVVGSDHGFVHRVTQRVPMPSIKIIIVLWQILTQFASVASVTFPEVYQTFLDSINVINFDLTWVMSFSCFVDIDFHDRLLWTTIAPIVTMSVLGGTYAIAVNTRHGSPEAALVNIRQKHISMALFVTFLVYSSVSSVVFQMFACDDLDDGNRYLRADYSIQCDSPKHEIFQIYAGLMIILYPVGIPALYTRLLFSNRHILQVKQGRKESLVARSTLDLWKPYKPLRFYYEVIECARRISLTGIVVFIYPNTAAQIVATFTIAVVFGIVSEGIAPYESSWDTWISRMSHGVIFVSMCLALLLKVDVSEENDTSKNMFGIILVAAHGCMVIAVVVEAFIMAMALETGKQEEDPIPRRRYTAKISRKIHVSLVAKDEDCKMELQTGGK